MNCPIIEKYKEMHAGLEGKTARSVKEGLRVRVDDWKSSGKKGSMPVSSFSDFFQASWQLRLCATFSYLVKLKAKHGLVFTWTELVRNKWLAAADNCPYDDNVEELYESSSKLQRVMKILNKPIATEDGQKERILIMFFSPVIAKIV